MIAEAGAAPAVVDVGIGEPRCAVDVSRHEVAAYASKPFLYSRDRGEAVAAMGAAFERFVVAAEPFDAIIGIGGGGGTSIITRGMRALPIGLPKLMVSTLASGDVGPYVDVSDITMTPSITDLAGLNSVSRVVLRNAAFAIAGMAAAGVASEEGKPSIGLTMFGVTTPCVTRSRREPARSVRLSRLSRDRDGRPSDGETGRQRPARRRHRCDDH